MLFNLRHSGKTEIGQAVELAHLDFVHVMVAAQEQQPDLGLGDIALVVLAIGGQHQRFDGRGQRHVQQRGDVFAGALSRCRCLGHRLAGCRTRTRRRQGFGLFHIGRVFAARAVHDGVFTGGRNHLEFFAQITANSAAVSRHRAVGQTKSVKNLAVRTRHDLVASLGSVLVTVKAVRIFHRELAPTHQPKTGAALITELGLDLVEVLGQLLVALDLLARNVRHHLFTGRLDHKVAVVPVLDAQQFGAHLLEAAGFLPQLCGLHHRHGHLDGTRAVHFLPHDGFDLANHAQAHGHVAVDAGTQLLDHARAHHQLVADHFRIGGRFFEGGNEKLGCFHGVTCDLRGSSPLDPQQSLCIMNEV